MDGPTYGALMTAQTVTWQVRKWGRETRALGKDAVTPLDFARLMQSRLSLSKIGGLVCPRAVTKRVSLDSLGPDVALRSHTSDICVLEELLLAGDYSHLPPAGADVRTVVDLGANTGLAFRWLHHRYPHAWFVCVEPEPGNVEILRENVDTSGAAAVRVIEACVGGTGRTTSLETTDGEYGFRMTDQPGDVDVITMDRVLELGLVGHGGPVDVLKVDIEGAEEELFADCSSWIGRVKWLVVECHAPYTATRLQSDLAASGGRFERVHLERFAAIGSETVTLRASGAGTTPR